MSDTIIKEKILSIEKGTYIGTECITPAKILADTFCSGIIEGIQDGGKLTQARTKGYECKITAVKSPNTNPILNEQRIIITKHKKPIKQFKALYKEGLITTDDECNTLKKLRAEKFCNGYRNGVTLISSSINSNCKSNINEQRTEPEQNKIVYGVTYK